MYRLEGCSNQELRVTDERDPEDWHFSKPSRNPPLRGKTMGRVGQDHILET
jgi:hypothetical protein